MLTTISKFTQKQAIIPLCRVDVNARVAGSSFFRTTGHPQRVCRRAAGSALAVYGGARRGPLGAGLGAAGLLLTTRAITNTDFTHLASQAKQLYPGGGTASATNVSARCVKPKGWTMEEQQSQKSGVRSEAQKADRARDGYDPIPPANPVSRRFWRS